MSISIVIPCYQAELLLDELISRISKSLQRLELPYEVILVDDGSSDHTWGKIQELCRNSTKVKGIKLSRNFGQHHAITAGIDQASCEWLVVMDCDLQDQPEEIVKLYQTAITGFEIVYARRIERNDSLMKRLTSKLFYKVLSLISGIHYDGTIGNFGIYHRKVYSNLKKMREPMRAFSPMVRWVGFQTTGIDVKHGNRFQGKSTYNWGKLLNLGIEIMISYSNRPLLFSIKLGFFLSVAAILFSTYNVFAYLTGKITVIGYASLIASIWLLSGIMLFFMGILGLYISKVFDGIKHRPIYIVERFENINHED